MVILVSIYFPTSEAPVGHVYTMNEVILRAGGVECTTATIFGCLASPHSLADRTAVRQEYVGLFTVNGGDRECHGQGDNTHRN